MTEHFSDECLNAFIDNELAHDERQRLITALKSDAELNRRLNELRTVRDMVQLAYPLQDRRKHPRTNKNTALKALAASVLVCLGILIGWGISANNYKTSIGDIARAVNKAPAGKTTRVVLHVTTANPDKLQVVLDETEYLLKKYASSPGKLKIAILANGKGLQLLRANGSAFGQRLVSLRDRYPNLTLQACNKTLQRMQKRAGASPKLLPNTEIVPSAMREVILKQRQGWTHIQI